MEQRVSVLVLFVFRLGAFDAAVASFSTCAALFSIDMISGSIAAQMAHFPSRGPPSTGR
ncbi:hypothetical protein M427DRAFT_55103 [Gonapodya prolifera JEL478]|uniref:Uncharacterized protein n=1 Tax=Gonapodya prolifera (strain JEL478) TaxID=1344416 RepID=A0A139AIZ6_GONPJ|nr:hypothetical protein M427DRAFT_55103 [Gonapodya prolifera JEL478]|eukprot:KXS16760.1 hypothetical protein M427DRAFT_55103 [Gonapodya prolifera JEL478]